MAEHDRVYFEPVAVCACGGALFVEACREYGSAARFHCARCGYCGIYARRSVEEEPKHHVAKGAA